MCPFLDLCSFVPNNELRSYNGDIDAAMTLADTADTKLHPTKYKRQRSELLVLTATYVTALTGPTDSVTHASLVLGTRTCQVNVANVAVV